MRKNLLCLVSNIRAVALCLAVVCSTIASWAAIPTIGETFTNEGVQYTVTMLYYDPETHFGRGHLKVASQTLTGDVVVQSNIWISEEEDFVAFTVDDFDLSQMTISDNLTSLTVYNSDYSVAIPEDCFKEKFNLKTVSFSGKVSSIGDCAFFHCSSLKSFSFGEGSTFTTIGQQAFNNCALEEVTIPARVTYIDYAAFCYCYSLKKVTCLGTTPPECSTYVFYYVGLTDCTLVVPTDCENTYKSADVWNGFGNIVDPSGVEDVTVDDNAVEVERYNVNGVKLSAPQVGVNIVKMSDGSVKKVVVNE